MAGSSTPACRQVPKAMLGHYFTAAWRNLRATPFVSALNVFTLAIGFAMFFAAFGFVRSVETTDGHFAKADRTYVITTNFTVRASGFSTGEWNSTPAHVAKYLKTDLPEFETVARLSSIGEVAMAADERKGFLHAKAADPSFLEALDLPFVQGNAVDALDRPGSVVLTLRAARQLFGGEDPMGRAVILVLSVRCELVSTGWSGILSSVVQATSDCHSAHAAERRSLKV